MCIYISISKTNPPLSRCFSYMFLCTDTSRAASRAQQHQINVLYKYFSSLSRYVPKSHFSLQRMSAYGRWKVLADKIISIKKEKNKEAKFCEVLEMTFVGGRGEPKSSAATCSSSFSSSFTSALPDLQLVCQMLIGIFVT